MKNPIRKVALSAFVLSLAITQGAFAATKTENTSTFGGALIGAAAGGPVGLIVGAALGGHYGSVRQQAADEKTRATELDGRLVDTRSELAGAQRNLSNLSGELARSQSDITTLTRDLEEFTRDQALLSNLQFDVMFRTDQARLSESGRAQIVLLGKILARHPELRVKLHGFADVRGEHGHNDVLSKERADAVAAVLASLDVDPSRIAAFAYGEREATAKEGDRDGYAIDRRVRIEFGLMDDKAGSEAVASRD